MSHKLPKPKLIEVLKRFGKNIDPKTPSNNIPSDEEVKVIKNPITDAATGGEIPIIGEIEAKQPLDQFSEDDTNTKETKNISAVQKSSGAILKQRIFKPFELKNT